MSLLKYIERFKRMDDLIRRKATGAPDEFASRLNISKSMLMYELNDLKDLGAEVDYCSTTKSYYYVRPFALIIGDALVKTKGGIAQMRNWHEQSTILNMTAYERIS